MKRIVLVGASLMSGNRGVNALTRGAINSLVENYGTNIQVRILSYTVKESVVHSIQRGNAKINVEEIPLNLKEITSGITKAINKHFYIKKILKETDIVLDISEGDSFSDIYGYKRFILHSIIKYYCIKEKVNIYLLPQTIGPFKSKPVKRAASYLLRNVNYTFIRDSLSYDVALNELNVPKNKIKYVPDIAFYMDPSTEINLSEYIPDDILQNKKVIGINVSGLLYNGGYTQSNMFEFITDYKAITSEIINYFMQHEDTVVLLIPHVIIKNMKVEDDLQTCKNIYNELSTHFNGRIFTIDKPLREDELKTLIGKCEFFIGGRMHACIGAISTNVPTVPIAYSRKFIGIWKDFGLEKCVADPRKQSLNEIMSIIEENYQNRINIRDTLIIKNKNIKKSIMEIYKEVTV